MLEIFVIYNKNTGHIDGGAGRIDREWDEVNKDGSTISECILEILAKNSDREVVYLPNQELPDPLQHKIVDGQIKSLSKAELNEIEQRASNEAKIAPEIRKIAIERLKTNDELPQNYV